MEDALEKTLKPAMMANVRDRFTKDPPSGSGKIRKQRPRTPPSGRVPSSNGSVAPGRPMRGIPALCASSSSDPTPLQAPVELSFVALIAILSSR